MGSNPAVSTGVSSLWKDEMEHENVYRNTSPPLFETWGLGVIGSTPDPHREVRVQTP